MGCLYQLICIRFSTEGASPPGKMNWMHADLQIEVENGFSSMIEKCPVWHAQGSIIRVPKNDRLAIPEWSPINCPYSYAFSKNKYDVGWFI